MEAGSHTNVARRKQDPEKRMELTEHLGELRSRLIRCIIYVVISATLCYFYFKPIYGLLFEPMRTALTQHQAAHPGAEWRIVFTHFTQAFFVVLEISVVAGLVLVAPAVTAELWGFVSPALTREEKRPLLYVAPLSIALFVGGVALAYWVARFAIGFFVGYVMYFPEGVLYQDPKAYVMFMLKIMGLFGLIFQMPVVLMFFAWVGLLRAAPMKRHWRTAIVAIAVIGLFITPTNDPFTMLMLIGPLSGLYVGSIWLVQIVERNRERRLAAARNA